MRVIGVFLFIVVVLFATVLGALQCFAPRTLRNLQKRFRIDADWSGSAGGKLFEDLEEWNARNPSVSYRAGGAGVMLVGIYILIRVLVRLLQ